MKKQALPCTLFLILVSLLLKPVFAESITTGNATAKSSVETKIEGSSSVTTHIEVEANGEKKVLDANEPGSYSVSVESNSNSDVSPSSTPSGTPYIENNNRGEKSSFISTLVENIRNFFKRILDFF